MQVFSIRSTGVYQPVNNSEYSRVLYIRGHLFMLLVKHVLQRTKACGEWSLAIDGGQFPVRARFFLEYLKLTGNGLEHFFQSVSGEKSLLIQIWT